MNKNNILRFSPLIFKYLFLFIIDLLFIIIVIYTYTIIIIDIINILFVLILIILLDCFICMNYHSFFCFFFEKKSWNLIVLMLIFLVIDHFFHKTNNYYYYLYSTRTNGTKSFARFWYQVQALTFIIIIYINFMFIQHFQKMFHGFIAFNIYTYKQLLLLPFN